MVDIAEFIPILVFCMLFVFAQIYLNKQMNSKAVSFIFILITVFIMVIILPDVENQIEFIFYIMLIILTILLNMKELLKK